MSKAAERKVENAVASATAKVIKALGDKLSGKKRPSKKAPSKTKKTTKKKKQAVHNGAP